MSAQLAYGCELRVGDGASPENYSAVADVTGFNIDSQAPEVDATNLASSRKEYLQDLPDGSTISLTIQYDYKETTHSDLETMLSNRTQKNFEIGHNDGSPETKEQFAAIITGLSVDRQQGQVITATVNFRTTGAKSFA